MIDDLYIYSNQSIIFVRFFIDGRNTDIIFNASGSVKNQYRGGEKTVLNQSVFNKIKSLTRLNSSSISPLQFKNFAINFSHSFTDEIISKIQTKMKRSSSGALSLYQKYATFRDCSVINNRYRLQTNKFIQEIIEFIDNGRIRSGDVLTDLYLKYIDLVDKTDIYDFRFEEIFDIIYSFITDITGIEFSKYPNIIINTSNNFYLVQVDYEFEYLEPILPFSRELEIKFENNPRVLMVSLSEQNYMIFDEFLFEKCLYC